MIDNNGEVTLTIGEKPRVFKFGYKSLSLYEQKIPTINGNIEAMACMLWSGLMAKQKDNGLDSAFDLDDMMDLMGDMSEDDLVDLFTIGKKRADSLTTMGQKMQETANPAPMKKAV